MIDYSELINRISDMQDLPVSEEMLGAYCEGTLGSADAAVMDSCIANNAEIGELVDSVDNLHVADDTYLLGYSTESIDLPDVPMVGAFNPFEIDITPNIDNIGMVAFAADSAFVALQTILYQEVMTLYQTMMTLLRVMIDFLLMGTLSK